MYIHNASWLFSSSIDICKLCKTLNGMFGESSNFQSVAKQKCILKKIISEFVSNLNPNVCVPFNKQLTPVLYVVPSGQVSDGEAVDEYSV